MTGVKETARHPTRLPNLEVEAAAVERLGYGGRTMWIAIFAIAIAIAIFLSVAAVMMSVKIANVKSILAKSPFSLDRRKRAWAN
jgi:hypothetical protein